MTEYLIRSLSMEGWRVTESNHTSNKMSRGISGNIRSFPRLRPGLEDDDADISLAPVFF
jgi:hypothetical protein